MTAALLQKCNRCQKPFIKLHGCNKMTCTCGNRQCYVCGKSITDYRHFEVPGPDGKKCPLHGDSERREKEKVREAQIEATRRVVSEEGVREEDVLVEDPEKKKGSGRRRGRGRGGHAGGYRDMGQEDGDMFYDAGWAQPPVFPPRGMLAHHQRAGQMVPPISHTN
jgi:E3 ubiquitin-protein ligase RNF216